MKNQRDTQSIHLAAYLAAKGAPFLETRVVEGATVFSFEDTPTVRALETEFLKGARACVDARRFIGALDHLFSRQVELQRNYDVSRLTQSKVDRID